MGKYSPQNFELKWQKKWDSEKVYKTPNPGEPGFDANKKSYYILDMFPYPSGSGLHVGHASGYIGTDIIARRKRMEGYNVLHPMGWDAFGLPAEQYAIQTGQEPRITTEQNANNFRKQLKLLGLSYDWDREIDTSLPEYYKWTQWLFLKLYEKDLVYLKEVPVWWCEELKTVLANEEVISGRSERGNYPCVRRPLRQWVLKITEYADRLISDLDLLDWPESIKKMQFEWIGRSEGAEIDFPVVGSERKIRVFSTRADTLFGVTAVVLAPEHAWLKDLTTPACKAAVEKYVQTAAVKSDRERKSEVKEITGVFTGSYVLHPLIKDKKIPVYAADYVIAEYGTGAVMSVPAHDERDHLFAKTQSLPMINVIKSGDLQSSAEKCYPGEGVLENSDTYTGLASEEARKKITAELEKRDLGNKKITYKLKDWVFSRQRYWGEPFPLSFAPDGSIVPVPESDLPVTLPPMTDFAPSEDGSAPLARVPEWVKHQSSQHPGVQLMRSTDTMPGWAGSCWYYLRFMDPHNSEAAFSKKNVEYWQQVDLYIGGTAHAVMHLLYARFWHKVFYDLKIVPTPEPFKKLFNQGMVTAFAFKDTTGRLVASDDVTTAGNEWRRISNGDKVERFITKMSKSLRNVVNPDDVIATNGCDVLRIFEMFMGPLEDDKPWTNDGLPGCERFLKRVWTIFHEENGKIKEQFLKAPASKELSPEQLLIEQGFHRCLKRVNDSFLNFNFNTSVAAFMEFINIAVENATAMSRPQALNFIKTLSPFCPHVAAELWQQLGNEGWIDYQSWPELIPAYLEDKNYELVISVNGRPRKRLQVLRGTSAVDLESLAKDTIADSIAGQTIVKVIVVPDKLVNIVVK